jgi:signal transduction histidine kinase
MFFGKKLIELTSFRARIFCSLVPIFCVLLILLGAVDLYQQRQLAEEEINRRAQSMAENLAFSSRLAVLTEDRFLLESALRSVTAAADFAYVSVYGEKWTPLVDAGSQNADMTPFKTPLDEKRKELLRSNASTLSDSYAAGRHRFVEFIAPVVSTQSSDPFELQIGPVDLKRAEGEQKRRTTIGAVRLGLSLARVDAQMASFLKWRGWSLAVFLALSALAIYIFSVQITRPINQVTERARSMSQGLLDQSIPVNSRDEVGQLATSFNAMAQSLKELYANLEGKVAERTAQLTAANEKLAEVSEHKSRFLANVNHELRTPLSSIIGYGQVLQRESQGPWSPRQRENLEEVLRNAERLLGLIDSLLDFAKIEAGKAEVQFELVRPDELIHGALAVVEPMLNSDLVELVCDLPVNLVPLHTDPDKLRQIMLNLLGNAVKFTDQGQIKISACQDNGTFKLTVADTGTGIERADLSRIFEAFDRGRFSNGGGYRGTGLGLAIVKSLVDLLGGSIAVESDVGIGSTFTCWLNFKSALFKV